MGIMSINTLRNLAAGLMLSIGSGAGPAQAETLQEALMSAYTGNPGLMAERARVREFDENYVQAQSRGLLSSNLSGSAGWSSVRSSGTGFSGAGETAITHNQPASLQLQVIQPVYQGGRVGALKAQARAGVLSARQNLRNIEQSILLSTAAAYSDVISAEEAARIRRNGVRVLAQQKNAAQARFEVGEGTRTDIALADSRMAAAEIGLAQADARLQVARASYVRATGHMPENLQPVPEFILPQNLTEAIRIGRNNNPQLIAAVFNE
ncbi:MAG: TolC family protein, partial [Hyphomonadaceae bacterium]|nr:TolC family protein [Hyphomonadaceae bacterium]